MRVRGIPRPKSVRLKGNKLSCLRTEPQMRLGWMVVPWDVVPKSIREPEQARGTESFSHMTAPQEIHDHMPVLRSGV